VALRFGDGRGGLFDVVSGVRLREFRRNQWGSGHPCTVFEDSSFAPLGLALFTLTHGSRRGLYSGAASRLDWRAIVAPDSSQI
jgi:hypothetical protein